MSDFVSSLPFADNPRLLLLIAAAVGGWILTDQVRNGGQWLNKILRANNTERLVMRENVLFNNGGKIDSISQIHFISDELIQTPYGPELARRAVIRNGTGVAIWEGTDREIRIPLEALTTGEPCMIAPFNDKNSEFAKERQEYLRRIAVLEGERNEAWTPALDFAGRIAVSAGRWKKELGGTMMMRPNGQGGFSAAMPFNQDGGGGDG